VLGGSGSSSSSKSIARGAVAGKPAAPSNSKEGARNKKPAGSGAGRGERARSRSPKRARSRSPKLQHDAPAPAPVTEADAVASSSAGPKGRGKAARIPVNEDEILNYEGFAKYMEEYNMELAALSQRPYDVVPDSEAAHSLLWTFYVQFHYTLQHTRAHVVRISCGVL